MLDAQTTGSQTTATPDAALSPVSFATAGFAANEAFDAWHGWFGALNEIMPAEGAAFAAQVDYWRLGGFVLGSNVSSPMRLVRNRAHARRDGLDHWVLRVSRRGIVRSRSDDRAYVSRPGDLILERLSGCYDDDWSADEWVALIFAPDTLPELDRTLETLGAGPVPGARSGLVADYLLALERRLPGMTQADVPAISRATQAMLATLSTEVHPTSQRPTAAARLRAERVIRGNLASARLNSQRIAALAGVSRTTLYRLFEDVGGVATHVRRLRLDAVHAALMDPDKDAVPINMIAAEAGCHCAASFNRSFKARFGASPGEVRAAKRLKDREPAARSVIGAGTDFLDSLFARKA